MEYINGKIRKGVYEHFEHFQLRLKQRYNIKIDRIHYELLHQAFNGVFKKNKDNTIGWLMVNDVKVWALYRKDNKCLTTCYPPNIETDAESALYSCFGGTYRHVGSVIYQTYLQEAASIKNRFDDDKEAALWFFENTLFPTIHIDKYKHGSVSIFKIMAQVRSIMLDNSEYLKLTVVKR